MVVDGVRIEEDTVADLEVEVVVTVPIERVAGQSYLLHRLLNNFLILP